MSDSEELASKERRRRLIERLNEKEKLIGRKSPTPRGQMSEEVDNRRGVREEGQRVVATTYFIWWP